MPDYQLSHLDQLEGEAIFILRETAAQFENPALLFSGGKDSIVMVMSFMRSVPGRLIENGTVKSGSTGRGWAWIVVVG